MRLASHGLCDLDTGPQPVTDRSALAQIRRQARGVHLRSLLAGAIVTLLLLLV